MLRFGLMLLVSALLIVPALRLAAAVFLLWIAVRLLNDPRGASGDALVDADPISPARITVGLFESVSSSSPSTPS